MAAAVNALADLSFGPREPAPLPGSYEPTPKDVFIVSRMLIRAKRLPPDIVDSIFDFAEYWAHSTNYVDFTKPLDGALRIAGSGRFEDKLVLRSFPVGLTRVYKNDQLPPDPTWNTHAAEPQPLETECDPSVFREWADYPTPRLLRPVRKIVFKLKSHDQGYGGQASEAETKLSPDYAGSWTWFEVGLERFDADDRHGKDDLESDERPGDPEEQPPSYPSAALRPIWPAIKPDDRRENEKSESDTGYLYDHPLHAPQDRLIQRNKRAKRTWQEHEVVWRWDDNTRPDSPDADEVVNQMGRGRATMNGEFVRDLKLGDVVTIWGKARFPGWINIVAEAKIEIYWAL